MSVLTKITNNFDEKHKWLIYYLISDFINKKNIPSNYLLILDCFNNIHVNDKKFIPQIFNNDLVFISSNSFQQNHCILSKYIRKYVSNIIKNKSNLVCIGGESYLYGLTCNIKTILHFTNSKYIYDDCAFNSNLYKKTNNIINNIVDYNNPISGPSNFKNVLINISSLTSKLLININNTKINKIIIINCHHDDN